MIKSIAFIFQKLQYQMQIQQTRIRELTILEESLKEQTKEKDHQIEQIQERQTRVNQILQTLPKHQNSTINTLFLQDIPETNPLLFKNQEIIDEHFDINIDTKD